MNQRDQRLIIAIVIIVLVLAILIPLLMWAAGSAWMADWGFSGMMGGWWGFMGLTMALPLIIIVVVLLIIMREEERNVPIPPPPPVLPPMTPPAVQILDMRYARGELSREEYWRMREELTGGKRPGA